jgi:hypothetical protein
VVRARIRPTRSQLIVVVVVVIVIVVALVYYQRRHATPPSTAPQPGVTTTSPAAMSAAPGTPGQNTTGGAISNCGGHLSPKLRLRYRDGTSETRVFATFFPWGCPTKASDCQFGGDHRAYPDPACTPGAIYDLTVNRDPARYDELANQRLLCATYADDRRHVLPADDADTWKHYGSPKPKQTTDEVETDHTVALALGGSNDIANLTPQHAKGPYNKDEKDTVERRLIGHVCDPAPGNTFRYPLGRLQNLLRFHWTGLYDGRIKL